MRIEGSSSVKDEINIKPVKLEADVAKIQKAAAEDNPSSGSEEQQPVVAFSLLQEKTLA
jgi:hypothetical protein